MYLPEATYRIQFHKDFTFAHLRAIIPYLRQLGIRTIYASPIFAAVPGSTHGYDGIDPNAINPEIGTLDEFRQIAAELKQQGMGWLQDFVPNHMAFTPLNPWLCDFLEKGKMSFYDHYFDKNPDEALMAPFLGKSLPEVLAAGELKIIYDNGRLKLSYYDSGFPLNYTAVYDLLHHERFDSFPFAQVWLQLDQLSQVTGREGFQDAWTVLWYYLEAALADAEIADRFATALTDTSADQFLLQRLCAQQFYRLCHWQETDVRINYRRFFTINGLIGMNMQHPDVFEHYHRLLFQLIEEGAIQGVRIDHIDGLYDPAAYLDQLRQGTGPEVYIVVEKILEAEEQLPSRWPVQGTTGYDFLAIANQALTNKAAEAVFTDAYELIAPAEGALQQQVYRYKRKILDGHMGGELDNLLRLWKAVPGMEIPVALSEPALKELIAALLVCCPVYRFYPRALPFDSDAKEQFNRLLSLARQQKTIDDAALDFFGNCFSDAALSGAAYSERLLHFWRCFMQLSGPLMAKGVEDTLMYNFLRFPAHNEVGDNPASFGIDKTAFHEHMQQRQAASSLALNATATHDTKRGEEARARLRWTSYDASGWWAAVTDWLSEAKEAAGTLRLKDQYFVLQAVYAHLPVDAEDANDFEERLSGYLRKAVREAKEYSTWDHPDEPYEAALIHYGLAVAAGNSQTGKAIREYLVQQQAGILRQSLIQLTLKCTCPGVPDIYQGTEWVDLSFVDPDNRRPVDYKRRALMLQRVAQKDVDLLQLDKEDPGTIKLFVLHRLLQLRSTWSDVFNQGLYQPVIAGGTYLSYMRRNGQRWLWVVASPGGHESPPVANFGLPPEAPRQWQSLFTGRIGTIEELDITSQLASFSVAVFTATAPDAGRKAGVLLPLFSLPSSQGIGSLGRSSFDWIRFLSRAGQRLWQLLPLNPISEGSDYSPYAASSAFAGEPLYIDLEQLVDEQLLPAAAIKDVAWPATGKVDYGETGRQKNSLLQLAWRNFCDGNAASLEQAFALFRTQQHFWLDDYALYVVLKQKHNHLPWYEWPEAFRDRHPEALQAVKAELGDAIACTQWLQFLFSRQWARLKHVAAQHGVALMGDLPFYMNHDSADVWVHRHCFMVADDGTKTAQAGVPPDYFSETGQLWGMPTYNWEVLHREQYAWWIQRLAANNAMYDLVRLDHFRAFYDYWELPGNATTAIEGVWRNGPRQGLFDLLQQHFPSMPFIAEDLGEIHQGVFAFKDKYHLPGMRVLQFGFSQYDGTLRDLPHNFDRLSVVYTGTHDNDTTLGWYAELGAPARAALSRYAGTVVTKENVAGVLCRMAYASVAGTLVLPLQDILGLDSRSRINTPSTTAGNWRWRLNDSPDDAIARRLLKWVNRYNR